VEELIQKAAEAVGVNAELHFVIGNEMNDLANNPQMHVPFLFPLLLMDEAGAPPDRDSVLIREQDENSKEFAHGIREAAILFIIYNKRLRLIE